MLHVTLPKKLLPKTVETLNKSTKSAQETTKIMEQSYVAASKGAVDFNLKLLDMAQVNLNATLDFARQLSHVKSPSDFFELSAEHTRKQFEKFMAQTQDLTGLAQKAIKETAGSWQSAASTPSTSWTSALVS